MKTKAQKKYAFHPTEHLTDDDVGSGQGAQSEWLTSYADIVTLLLCFFIMFFTVGKSSEVADPLTKIIASFDKDASGDAAKAKRAKSETELGSLVETKRNARALEAIRDELASDPETKLQHAARELVIDFSQGAFFEKAGVTLTGWGRMRLARVAQILSTNASQVVIEIRGHTDQIPVVQDPDRRFQTNVELSALRAIAALEFFATLGVPRASMVIGGYADVLPSSSDDKAATSSSSAHTVSDLETSAFHRRISLRVFPK